MRRLLEHKSIVILFALAGLVGLGLLAAALREVEFRPTGPLPFQWGESGQGIAAPPPMETPLVIIIIVASLILSLIALIIAFIDPKLRKRILLRLLRMALTILAVWWLMEYSGLKILPDQELLSATPGSVLESLQLGSEAPPQYTPPQTNPWLGFLISFLVALGLVALAWFLASRRSKPRRTFPQEMADIAREALDGLQPGQNWDNAIVKAYVRMNEVVSAERGLIRQPWVTPAEFAFHLEKSGLPGEAARVLTRLFEQVRYGGQTSTAQDRDLASAALSAILRTCGVKP